MASTGSASSSPREAVRGTEFEELFARARIDRRTPIWSQVHTLLRDAIAGMKLVPGRGLSEQEISHALGISRTPVREGLIRLSEEGLVDIYPQYGTFVSPIRIPAVMEAHFIRDSLECSIARKVAERPDPDVLRKLDDLVTSQLRAVDAGDQEAFYELDERMHEMFSVACGRQGVWRFIHAAKVHVDRVRHLMLPQDLRFRSLVDEHAAIVAAMAEGSPTAAAATMHEHLEGVIRGLPDVQKRHPEFFDADSVPQRPSRQERE